MKLFKRLAGAISIALILCVSIVTPVAASVAAPDSLTLIGCYAYRNNIETGDMTFLFYYNCYYATTYPTEVSTDTLLCRLMDTDGTTELGNIAPFPYYSNGYQRGVALIYFTAAQVTAKGMVWSEAFTSKIVGNPLIDWSAAPADATCAITWDTATTQDGAQENLGNRIISLALQLKAYWGINLVEATDGLHYALTVSSTSGSGVDYFLDVASNMGSLAPDIFPTQVEQPIYKTTTPPLTYAPDELPVDSAPAALLWGMSKGTMNSLLAMIGVLLFSFFLVSQSPQLSRYIFLFDGVIIIFLTRIGAVVPVWATLVATVCLLIIGYMIFYEKSSA